MIELLYCGNDRIFDGLLTSLLSIIKYHKEPIHVHILTLDLQEYNEKYKPINEDHISFLQKVIQEVNPQSKITKYDLKQYKDELLNSANIATGYTPYTFLRLYATELNLPDKILYLDMDIMAYKDIQELYDINIEEYEYAAVKDYYGQHFFNKNYINAGMLLLNLKMIKQTELFDKTRKLCNEKKLFLPDQTALNKLTTKRLILDEKYNAQKKLRQNTVLRHFCKTLKFFPYFRTLNVKQWDIENVHKKLKCHEFDDVLDKYLILKNEFTKQEIKK